MTLSLAVLESFTAESLAAGGAGWQVANCILVFEALGLEVAGREFGSWQTRMLSSKRWLRYRGAGKPVIWTCGLDVWQGMRSEFLQTSRGKLVLQIPVVSRNRLQKQLIIISGRCLEPRSSTGLKIHTASSTLSQESMKPERQVYMPAGYLAT